MAITRTKVERERERERETERGRERETLTERERDSERESEREREEREFAFAPFSLVATFCFCCFFRGVGGHRPSFQICSKPKACIMGFERAETGSVLHDTMFAQASLHV